MTAAFQSFRERIDPVAAQADVQFSGSDVETARRIRNLLLQAHTECVILRRRASSVQVSTAALTIAEDLWVILNDEIDGNLVAVANEAADAAELAQEIG